MKDKLLTVVRLNPDVRAYAERYYEILTVDELDPESAGSIEVILSNGTGIITRELLDRLPNVRLIDNFGVGYDGVDVGECRKRGIALCTTPGVLTADVADLALAFILNLSRALGPAERFLQRGEWGEGRKFGLSGSVTGRILGIVGLGRIGSAVARRAAACDMQIRYYDRSVTDDRYVKCASLLELAAQADFLVLCASAGPGSEKLVNAEVLRALGSGGYLINVARGSLVDEEALSDSLSRGLIRGAALDVFEHEPRVPGALLGRDNVILTPHIASATRETRAKMAQIVIGNLKAFREGTAYLTRLDL